MECSFVCPPKPRMLSKVTPMECPMSNLLSPRMAPRIVIGDSSFPLQSQTEEIPHDLYLRSTTAAKPFAPLKFHANIIGKLTISERELDDELASRIHKSTAAAAEQRSMSKTKFIDANELPLPTSKSTKKKPDPFRRPVRPGDQPKTNVLNSSSSSSTALPARPSRPQNTNATGVKSMHKRLIHFLAVAERTSEEAIKAVGGPNCDTNTRQEISEALEMVAEQGKATKGSQQIWRLKNKSWLEVRPYEWPRLSETDRINLARSARRALKALGIPESDPRWEHAKYRPPFNPTRTDSPIPSIPSTSASVHASASAPTLAKRGINSTKEVRDKKTRKTDPKVEIMIKDETVQRPGTTSTTASNNKSSATSTSSSTTVSSRLSPVVRKPPGSGYKRLPQISGDVSQSTSPIISSSASSSYDVDMKDNTRRPTESKAKAESRASISRGETSYSKKEEGELSTSSNGPGGIGVRNAEKTAPLKRVKHLREEAMDSDRESDRSKDYSKNKTRERADDRTRSRDRNMAKGRDRDTVRRADESLERDKQRDREPSRRHGEMATLKRKKIKEEEDEYEEGSLRAASKKRKTENPEELLSAAVVSRARGGDGGRNRERDRDTIRRRDLEGSRDEYEQLSRNPRSSMPSNESSMDKKPTFKSLSAQSKAVFKDPTPLPVPISHIKKEPSPISPLPPLNVTSSTKGSSSKGTKLRRKSPIYTSSEDEDHSRQISPPASSSSSRPRSYDNAGNDASRSPDNNRRTLRTKYTASYVEYLGTLHTLLAQKSEIERLLATETRSGSRTDSDGEVELLDYEGLSKILSENKQQWEGLQRIQQAWEIVIRNTAQQLNAEVYRRHVKLTCSPGNSSPEYASTHVDLMLPSIPLQAQSKQISNEDIALVIFIAILILLIGVATIRFIRLFNIESDTPCQEPTSKKSFGDSPCALPLTNPSTPQTPQISSSGSIFCEESPSYSLGEKARPVSLQSSPPKRVPAFLREDQEDIAALLSIRAGEESTHRRGHRDKKESASSTTTTLDSLCSSVPQQSSTTSIYTMWTGSELDEMEEEEEDLGEVEVKRVHTQSMEVKRGILMFSRPPSRVPDMPTVVISEATSDSDVGDRNSVLSGDDSLLQALPSLLVTQPSDMSLVSSSSSVSVDLDEFPLPPLLPRIECGESLVVPEVEVRWTVDQVIGIAVSGSALSSSSAATPTTSSTSATTTTTSSSLSSTSTSLSASTSSTGALSSSTSIQLSTQHNGGSQTVTVVRSLTPTATTSSETAAASGHTSSSLWSGKGFVAGTFAIVAIGASLITCLIFFGTRRRRASKLDRESKEATRDAARTATRVFSDDDEDRRTTYLNTDDYGAPTILQSKTRSRINQGGHLSTIIITRTPPRCPSEHHTRPRATCETDMPGNAQSQTDLARAKSQGSHSLLDGYKAPSMTSGHDPTSPTSAETYVTHYQRGYSGAGSRPSTFTQEERVVDAEEGAETEKDEPAHVPLNVQPASNMSAILNILQTIVNIFCGGGQQQQPPSQWPPSQPQPQYPPPQQQYPPSSPSQPAHKPHHKPHHHQTPHSPDQSQPQGAPSPPSHPHSPRPDPNQVNQHDTHYMDLRRRANEEGDAMAKCFQQSHEAYARGDGAGAKDLSNQGKEHQRKMEQLNKQASDWIFVENNKVKSLPLHVFRTRDAQESQQDSKPGEIDLHGLYVKEAIAQTDNAIEDAKRRGVSEIHLIVGKGLHSQGGAAKIKPAVEELMKKHQLVAELDPHNAGVLIVQLGGRRDRAVGPDEITRRLERNDEGCIVM
ncbi:hypothetical protein D9757_004324 [Collybiopsis confluens]|uniref:Smr domain-containing protein n=1 Tax=Collybiopsis confluens TaxID=2823264 RepID=A0A8H5MCK7_9AGAR|nr:hypothetical protein D9757_004324 [Collybiopsis confluens]